MFLCHFPFHIRIMLLLKIKYNYLKPILKSFLSTITMFLIQIMVISKYIIMFFFLFSTIIDTEINNAIVPR
uniref:Uncharacterized protein n=1 Tax=Rhizophora mucronata TaxID=61149 RepID=A0A2P2IS01_RHIMU